MQHYATNHLVKVHPNGVLTFGSTEPVLSILDVRGFELRNLFLIGINDNCGNLIVPTEARALSAQAALEPAFETKAKPFNPKHEDWSVEYTLRDLDGTVRNALLTDITLTDGTRVVRDGRRVR
ncbi:hypothetical protein ACH4FE_35760 [Streptomyces celluloflavus]|uniref:hypothetical protein n=1 Tax=Streptomyces celluloflavus TaxID=58344 RepID=UPI003793AB73